MADHVREEIRGYESETARIREILRRMPGLVAAATVTHAESMQAACNEADNGQAFYRVN